MLGRQITGSRQQPTSRHVHKCLVPLSLCDSCLRLTNSHDLRVLELKLASLGAGAAHVVVVLAGSETISNEMWEAGLKSAWSDGMRDWVRSV